jgi:hypothetical protein
MIFRAEHYCGQMYPAPVGLVAMFAAELWGSRRRGNSAGRAPDPRAAAPGAGARSRPSHSGSHNSSAPITGHGTGRSRRGTEADAAGVGAGLPAPPARLGRHPLAGTVGLPRANALLPAVAWQFSIARGPGN